MIGRTLSHFRITAKLGAGGMGEVYRAEDTALDRQVAIKVLPEILADQPDRRSRFEREAKLLASLNHPNIAGIHEIGHQDDCVFLVMELVEGETLAERIARRPLALPTALRYARAIALALEAAHARGVIHRDLKPQNVKITPDDEVKLLDFGLAKALDPAAEASASEMGEAPTVEAQLTATGTILGTTAYMSPEQIRAERVDQRTDVWAFGCLLYEMLVGARPFERGSAPDTTAAILKDDVDFETLPPQTPPTVLRLLQRCLRKQPERRLHHIADARIELEEALEGLEATGADTPSGTRSGARPPGTPGSSTNGSAAIEPGAAARRRSALAVVGLLLVAAVAIAFLTLRPDTGSRGAVTSRSIAVLPFETLGRDEATVFTQGIHGDMLTRLSKVADLEVTSRTSVMQYRDSRAPLPQIASELGVTWVLRGEVQEIGDRVQVNARLVNAREDRQVWAESYRRELTAENLFDIQAELTREIVNQLEGQLSPDEERAMAKAPTQDLDAYRLYSQGRALFEQRTEGEMRKAAGYFQQAIDRDPSYSLAWAGLADALSLQGFYDYSPLAEVLPDALVAARRAQDLDPDLAEAHASLGIVLSLMRDGPAAVRELRRSLELNPSYAESYAFLGWVEDLLGRPEKALEAAERSVELNPLAPAYHVYLAEAYMANGKLGSALAAAQKARQLQNDYALAHYMEGLVLHHLGRADEAEAALARSFELALPYGTPAHSEIRAALAVAYAATGDLTGARTQLEAIDPERDPFAAGLARAALGETEEALRLLGSIREWGYTSTAQVRYFFPQVLGPLRAGPEFTAILRRVDQSFGLGSVESTS